MQPATLSEQHLEFLKQSHDIRPTRDAYNSRPIPMQLAQPCACRKVMRSARSLSFLMPANTIFVPGMYFFGLTRYSNMCLSDHTIPEFLFASEYANPSQVPEVRPMMPHRGGPCFALPPFSTVWH